MILESRLLHNTSAWFTALISKREHLSGIYDELKNNEATGIKTIPIAHGNKISRIVAWNFSLLGNGR
jgi:23S rRNA (adenine1618-N6)-methyltransferase